MDERVEATVATYEVIAEEYQTRHGDRSDVASIVDGFRERVPESRPRGQRPLRILDVGCGPGWETETFVDAGFDAIGLDITPRFLAAARNRAPAAEVLRGDMRTLPIGKDAVDGVFALASLLHVPADDVDGTLAEFARVTAPDGVLTIVAKRPVRASRDAAYGDRDRRHFEYYEPDSLRSRVENAGFDVDTVLAEDGWVVLHARLP